MGGDAGSTFANIAGRGIGVLAALESLRSPGGLANFMLQRQRFLTEPGLRETLVGSPFASGFFQVGGERVSPGRQLVAPPAGFMGPTIPTVAGPAELGWQPERWQPSLPPLGPEQFLKTTAQREVMAGLASDDPIVRTQAKLQAGIPLTAEELPNAVAQARKIQELGGAGSQVQLDIPGGRIAIGSPYTGLGQGGTLDPTVAAEIQRVTGKVPILTERGIQFFEPQRPPGVVETPAQGEMPLEQLTPSLLPGQVPQPTGRRDAQGRPLYQAVTPPKVEAVPPPLPALPGQVGGPPSAAVPPPAAGARPPAAARMTTPTTGGPPATIATRTNNPGNIKDGPFARSQPGYVGPGPEATDGGRFAIFESPQAGLGAQANLLRGPAYRNLSIDRGMRKWSNQGYGGEIGASIGIDPRRTIGSLSDPELAALTTRQAIQEGFSFPEAGGGLPAAAPPAPAAPPPVTAAPSAPAPPARTAAAIVPGLVPPEERIAFPSPAPAAEAAVPGAAPPAPPIPPVGAAPVEPAVPQLPTQAQPLVVKRETQKGPTGERTLESAELPAEAATKAVGTLLNYRNYTQRLLAAFPDPAERAKYIGWLERPRRELMQLAEADPRFSDFRTLMAPFQLSFFDRAGAALTEFEITILREGLPTGREATATDFESKLAYFPDLIEEQLAFRFAQQRTPIEAQTAEWADAIQRQIDEARAARWAARGLGPPPVAREEAAAEPAPPAPAAPPPAPPPATPPAAPTAAAPSASAGGVLPRIARAVVAPERSFLSLLPSVGGATAGGLGGAALGAMTGPLAPVAIPAGALIGATVGSVGGEAAQMGAETLGLPAATEAPAGERLKEAAIRGVAGEAIGAPLALGGRLVARPVVRAAEALAPVIRGPAAPWRMTSSGALSRATRSGERVLANVLRDPEELARVSLTPENRAELLAAWWKTTGGRGRGALLRAWDELPVPARENLAGPFRGDLETLVAAARRTTATEWKNLLAASGGGGALGYVGGAPPLLTAAAPVALEGLGRVPGLLVTPRLGAGVAGPWLRWGAAGGRRAATQATSAAGLR